MSETRAELAAAIVNHGMSLLAGGDYQPAFQSEGTNYEITHRKLGVFHVLHTRSESGRGFQLLDVSQGKKLFSARKDGPNADWELVSIKRGDWESAFLLI